MKKIIVTGISGFVGKSVATHFRDNGYEVVGVSRTDPQVSDVQWVQADIRNTLAHLLPYDQFNAVPVIHCAALAADGKLNQDFYDVNVTGTKNAMDVNPNGKFIHISSSSIYDLGKPSVNVEEGEFNLDGYEFYNGYSYTKAVAEQNVLSIVRDQPSVTLRPHAIYGEGDTTLMPKIKERVRNGVLYLPGGGEAVHSLTHISNVLEAVDKALVYAGAENEAFNVTDGEPTLLKDAIPGWLPEVREVKSVPAQLTSMLTKLRVVSKYEVAQVGYERTYSLSKATSLLKYSPSGFKKFGE